MIPETYARKDWPRLVKKANERADRRITDAEASLATLTAADAALDTRIDALEAASLSRATLWFNS